MSSYTPAYIHSDTIHFMVGRPGLEPGEVKLSVLQTDPLPATVYRPIFISQ